MRESRYQQVSRIIYYLRNPPDSGRSIADIQFATRLSNSQIRRLITEQFPHCFKFVENVGWYLTGEPPVKTIPFDFNREVQRPHTHTEQPARAAPERAAEPPWTYNQGILRYLDSMFPGQTFEEYILSARDKGTLEDLIIMGKTIAHAGAIVRKTGKVDFK